MQKLTPFRQLKIAILIIKNFNFFSINFESYFNDKFIFSSFLKNIKFESFEKCSSLVDMIIPDSVVEIGNSVFSKVSNLNSLLGETD